jgi:photosynthetic reaction center cytochrome c subunit
MQALTLRRVLVAVVALTQVSRALAAQDPAHVKTAAEVNMNIQVLKALPAADLVPAMQFIAGSLGVDCSHCHVTTKTGTWPMESDDKPPKLVARRMLSMVEEINATQFGGRRVVTCATCHRGAVRPSTEIPLFEAPGAATAPGNAVLPTVTQVLDRFLQAIGGPEANARIASRAYRGTITAARDQPRPLEILEAAPDKLRATITRADGVAVQAVDGDTAWTLTPRGAVIEPNAAEAVRMRRLAAFHKNEMLGSLDPELAVIGAQPLNGRNAIVLEGRLGPLQTERLFFDSQTGLLVRRLVLSPTALGPLPEQTDYEDYRSVDGVKVAFVVRRATTDGITTQRYESVTVNVAVDPAQFQRPSGK